MWEDRQEILPRGVPEAMHSSVHPKHRVTWIEAAITGAVLAVLAALTVPQFSEASVDSRERELRAAVQVVRGQIEMYKAQHNSHYPSLAQFDQQMSLSTNSEGSTAAPGTSGFDRGPYLRCVPTNPYTGTRSVGNSRSGTSAWFYDESTGQFRPNHPPRN